jgi:flavin reductase (DIM6/NTAB) family NADH-FMN oxidoreductase RutF
MFYEPAKRNHGLPHDPFVAIVAPRPIGWISSMSSKGEINLAPYSFFNTVCGGRLPVVMFSSDVLDKTKDSASFIAETKEFVCNLSTWDLREQMNLTSPPYPKGVDEMKEAGLTPAPCNLVKVPRVAESPCALECKLLKFVELDSLEGKPVPIILTFGQVVGIHIDDRFISNGRLDTAAMKPLARCGYDEYATVEKVFSMARPAYPPSKSHY